MSLDWSDRTAWQWKYFGLTPPRRLPNGWRSQARREWDEVEQRQQERDEAFVRAAADHVRQLIEAAEVAKWRALVAAHGSATVERVVRRVDPLFVLPAPLRDVRPPEGGEHAAD